jgi:hypothetical protein
MKKYTKVGNLDDKQINIVNKKLNPTLRESEMDSHFCRLQGFTIAFLSRGSTIYPSYPGIDPQTLAIRRL